MIVFENDEMKTSFVGCQHPTPLVCNIWNFWSYVSSIHFQDIVSKKSERGYLNEPVSLLGSFGDDLDWFCIKSEKKRNNRGVCRVLLPLPYPSIVTLFSSSIQKESK